MFLAPRNIPLAQLNEGSQCLIYRFRVCLEVCLLFHSVRIMAGSLIRLSAPPFQNQPCTFTTGIWLFFLFSNTLTGRKWVKPLWTQPYHQGFLAVDFMLALFPSRMFCVSLIPSSYRGEGIVSILHPRCALSRPPVSGGCDGAWGGVSGSGGTCCSVGLRSEVGCPGPSPHRGSPHRPPLTRGHCCMGGFHCLPVGSSYCSLESEQNK